MCNEFLEVTAKFEAGTGRILPLAFMWQGRRIIIDQISDMRPAASLKHGGQGTRYTCRTGNTNYYLFCDAGRWFLERLPL